MKEPKVPDSSLSPEILRLTEKLAKDPRSKLFVPLAEEYIKCGMLEEAIMVLVDGLKIHPNFLSARVTLGKAYLEKGQIQEAKAQFEEVITANPDNLFSHRKLTGIYKDEGQIEKAMASCKAVLSFNPKDAQMKSLMEELSRLVERPAETEAQRPTEGPEPAAAEEAESPEPVDTEKAVEGTEEIVTEALADLYIKQGYYGKGIEIYQRLLAQDPSNAAIQRKLEETEVLIRLMPSHPEPVGEPPPHSVKPEDQPARQDLGDATTPPPPMDEKERQEAEKIKRLEAWLDSIRKGMRR